MEKNVPPVNEPNAMYLQWKQQLIGIRYTADKIIGIWFSFSHAVAKWIPLEKVKMAKFTGWQTYLF